MSVSTEAWCWYAKGEPTDLILKSVELPSLQEDDVLVENHVIGLNPVDWKMIEWGHPEWGPSHIPGVDGMGVITDIGSQVTHLKKGMRVCYHTDLARNGSFSRHTIVKAYALMIVPEACSDYQAAAFPCPSLTAWQAFQKTPSLAGKKVLINGAGGSVGNFLTQLLLTEGAEVYVTASPEHHEMLCRLGVKSAIDYRDADWKEKITLSCGEAFDAAFDMVSGKKAAELSHLLGYYAHLVAVQDRVEGNPIPPFTTCISLHEIALGAFHKFAKRSQIDELMNKGEYFLDRIASGDVNLHPNAIESFDKLDQHLAQMKREHHYIKYLIRAR